jgi:hypothetical protein
MATMSQLAAAAEKEKEKEIAVVVEMKVWVHLLTWTQALLVFVVTHPCLQQ